MSRKSIAWVFFLLWIPLTGCADLPYWLGGSPANPINVKEQDKRLPVVAADALVAADSDAQGFIIDVPDQASNRDWLSINSAMQFGHLGITGLKRAASVAAGDGADYEQGLVPNIVIADGVLYSMDGIGTISAHKTRDLDTRIWISDTLVEADEPALIGGGLAYQNHVLYATTGYGKVAAFDAKTGKKLWIERVGVPVRGSPQVAGNVVVIVTVDNQTLAFDSKSGRTVWTHRGIKETAGYLSAQSPVIDSGIVLAAYSSGELAALRIENGTPLWGDTLINPEHTRASDVFTGIDADPVVKDSIVYAISTSGSMVANALLNGRSLWQQKIDGHNTPWVAGNMVYLLSSNHQLVALSRAQGKIIWAINLAITINGHDRTPHLFGPILAGNALLVVNDEGELLTFRPRDGKKLGVYDVVSNVAAAPVIADGTLYLITKGADIVSYK